MGKIYVTGSKGFIGKCLMATLPEALPLDPDDAVCSSPDDTIIHLAESIPKGLDGHGAYSTNVSNLRMMLDGSVDGGRIVYVSSSVVHTPEPSLYKDSKIDCEKLCSPHKDRLRISIVRPYNVYGPGQPDGFVIPTIINQVISGATTIKVQNPDAKRMFVYVTDVVSKLIDAQEYISEVGFYYCSIADIVKMITDVTGTNLDIEAASRHRDEGPRCGGHGTISMHEGLKQTIRYFEEHKKEEKCTL